VGLIATDIFIRFASMKHISILIPQGDVSLTNIDGPRKLFMQVNDFLQQQGKAPLFKINLIGLPKSSSDKNYFTIVADQVISEVEKTDLIIIPAVHGDVRTWLPANKEFIPWINAQYKRGAEVASLCVGAFILAGTGLLNGKKCATHWVAANEFRAMYPDVNLVPDKILTDENGIYSSGGAFSFLNLILYLIEKYAGRDMAILTSKIFEIEIDRGSQSPFIMFNGQKGHEDEPVKKAQQFIENNYQEKISVDQLASMTALSRRNFERRFRKATSNSVVEYIQRVKIEAAKISLESSRENVNEVMYKVGYSDTKAFRSIFKKITGLSPLEYKNRYNSTLA
jgi:transcriptional regulator GlxA family with amidase domain